jgi:structural maintenance of chromosome 2
LDQINERVEIASADRLNNGGLYFEFDNQVKELEKEMAKLKTQKAFKSTCIGEMKNNLKDFQSSLEESNKSFELSKKHTESLEKEFSETMTESENVKSFILKHENLIQTITTGLSSSQGQENGYMDQLTSNLFY